MTEKKWDDFDSKLKEKLLDVGKVDNMQVEISEKGLSTHFDRLSGCIQQTIKEVVPPKKRVKFDGRKASEQTRALYAERIRAFNAKRKKSITKKERKAWHKTLSKSSKREYHDWIARWVKRIEEADNKGDTKAVYDGVATLAGKTRRRFTKQPTRKKKPKTKTKTADDKCAKKADDKNAKKAEDKDTATAKDKKADKAESEDEWDSIEGPNELGEL